MSSRSNITTQITEIVDQIEDLDGQIKELQSSRKDLMGAAKAYGFDTKILNAVIRRRRKERALVLEEDSTLQSYEDALGMELLE